MHVEKMRVAEMRKEKVRDFLNTNYTVGTATADTSH